MPNLEIHYDGRGDWAALYVDGVLDPDSIGDSYVAEGIAFRMLGVTIVDDSPFLLGQSQREGAARTLDEIAAYRERRDGKRAEADRLREDARRLVAQADAISSSEGAR